MNTETEVEYDIVWDGKSNSHMVLVDHGDVIITLSRDSLEAMLSLLNDADYSVS